MSTPAGRSTSPQTTRVDRRSPASSPTAFLAAGLEASDLSDGGIYGTWAPDDQGLPSFVYTFDELEDPRSPWPNSEGLERRDHFQVFGNRRINAMAVDYGYVVLFSNDRGPTWMNRFDEDQFNLGGGFSYIRTSDTVFCTAHLYAPPSATVERRFGIGYFETETRYANLRVRHRIFAPYGDPSNTPSGESPLLTGPGDDPSLANTGDDSLLIDEVEVENLGNEPLEVSHFEYWDVNRHQLATEWVRSGAAAEVGDTLRDDLNRFFVQSTALVDGSVLVASMRPKSTIDPPPPEAMSSVDWYPADIFLAALEAPVDEVYTDQSWFFGVGGPDHPEAVEKLRAGDLLSEVSAEDQPATLVIRSDLELQPGVPRTLRFAYGYLLEGKSLEMLEPYRHPAVGPFEASAAQWQASTATFTGPDVSEAMSRETVWRSAQLKGSSLYLDYYGAHVIPQGSAYLYLHGADGAPRDQALFSLAATYIDPPLAKETLRVIMGVTDARTGAITYSFTGHGINEAAYIHRKPSDLDLFLLMGLGEYLAATGDLAFLDEEVDFHPRAADTLPPGAEGRTVLDHVRAAFRHLVDGVGLGAHGLIKVHDGDWSDGVVYNDPSPRAILHTIRDGESVPNSQMALFVLPLMADLVAGADPALAGEMRTFVEALEAPVRDTFGSRWFGRAWMKDAQDRWYLRGNDREADSAHEANYIDLEAQPWGLLAGPFSGDDGETLDARERETLLDEGERETLLDVEQREVLLDEIEARLDDDSPIGARLTEGGQVWPAISGLLTWAYARYRPEAAWRSLEEHLYATHAATFPETWMGILSGPDGFISTGSDDAGGTWSSFATPMTDFPVANINGDAMWLLGLLRTVGIEPIPGGISITPRRGGEPYSPGTGGDTYSLNTALLRVDVQPSAIKGRYRGFNEGHIRLRVGVPEGVEPHVLVDGRPLAVEASDGAVEIPLELTAGEVRSFEVGW